VPDQSPSLDVPPAAPFEDGDPLGSENLSRQRALRAAVLIDALRCLKGAPGAYDRTTRHAAYRWVMSHDTRGPFSFVNVCDTLGFDPSRLRRALFQPSFPVVDDEPTLIAVRRRSVSPFSRAVRRPRRTRLRYAASS
jgi:hypothetical protein